MIRGKTIQVYLPDGNPRSIKVCDINISFVKGVFIPRNKLKDVEEYEDISKQGVYFLITEKGESLKFKIYIGEAENVLSRLKQHDIPDKEWNHAICFMSDKNNLNKAHYKFLESHCYSLAKIADICVLDNSVNPTSPQIGRQDKDLVFYFFEDLKIILGNLGYQIFDKPKPTETKELFYCSGRGVEAKGALIEDGFIVFSGSTSVQEIVPSAEDRGFDRIREKLKSEGTLTLEGDKLKFEKDFIFNSPSMAAGVVLGRSSNGWLKWRNDAGETLDERKRQD